MTETTTGMIAAPIAVAGNSKISLISDREQMLWFYEAPFYVAGVMKPAVINNGATKIGRISSIRRDPYFIESANYTDGSSERLADHLFRNVVTDGLGIVRTKLVHPGGPEPEQTQFTVGKREDFERLIYSLILCFGNKKTIVTAFGEQIETDISQSMDPTIVAARSAVVDKGKASSRIDVGGDRDIEVMKGLCDIVAREFHFKGIRWSLNDEKEKKQHLVEKWKAGPPRLEYTQEAARISGVAKETAKEWCAERGVYVVEEKVI